MRLKPSDIGACWDFALSRMRALKALGFEPGNILDIGAYHGSWSEVMWHVWPNAAFHLIEANEDCVPQLEQTGFKYDIALLDNESHERTYHKCQTGSGEGNGLFKENSVYPFASVKLKTKTLNDTLRAPDGTLPTFDMVKLDVQGAELKVIDGGMAIIKAAHIVQLECQIQSYNENAPLAHHVISYMDSIGFRLYDIIERHDNSRGMLLQADFLFARKDSPLFGLKVLT